jgi:hypothetical protein
VKRKVCLGSPEQIASWLKRTYPGSRKCTRPGVVASIVCARRDGLTQRKIAALDLNLAQEHIERVEKFLPETFVSRIRTNSLASLQCGTTVNGQSSKPNPLVAS